MNNDTRIAFHLPSPCGSITVRSSKNELVPFSLREAEFHAGFCAGSGAVYHSPHRYIIALPAERLETEKVYQIGLEGIRLRVGDTDECSQCVAGSGKGFSIAIGGTDINDGEKYRQYTARRTADDPPYTIMAEFGYDRSTFERYDLHILPDCSGFRFERLDERWRGEIVFLVAWTETRPGNERETEDAVQFWVL